MQDLVALYSSLGDPLGAGDLYSARAMDGRPRYRVGRDPNGNATLLISPRPTDDAAQAPVELRNLSYRPRCACRVQRPDGTASSETLAVLKCTSGDPLLREYFLRALTGTVESLSEEPDESEISSAVMRLAELFRALDAPPRSSLQGLWCELLLITKAPRVRQAATAWHADPHAMHDFSAGRQRLEVKSTMGPLRAHQFSLDQLRSSKDARVVVASFMLTESLRGPSIRDLWEMLIARPELTSDLRERVTRVLALGLGRDWREAIAVTFDVDLALKQLRIYDADHVPCVSADLPMGVSDVRFKAELTDAPHLPRAGACNGGGLLAAIFGP